MTYKMEIEQPSFHNVNECIKKKTIETEVYGISQTIPFTDF